MKQQTYRWKRRRLKIICEKEDLKKVKRNGLIDYIRLKYLANKTAILKHKNPRNINLRVSHRTRLKEFKNICRIKKNQFWQNEMIKLENVNNVVNFWKNWKQMGEDLINHNSLPENVDGQQWENHFKNLYTRIDDDIDEVMKKSDIPVNQVLNEKFNMEELKSTVKELKRKKQLAQTVLPMNY